MGEEGKKGQSRRGNAEKSERTFVVESQLLKEPQDPLRARVLEPVEGGGEG